MQTNPIAEMARNYIKTFRASLAGERNDDDKMAELEAAGLLTPENWGNARKEAGLDKSCAVWNGLDIDRLKIRRRLCAARASTMPELIEKLAAFQLDLAEDPEDPDLPGVFRSIMRDARALAAERGEPAHLMAAE